MCLSRSLSEQNADRKCSCRNDSLHRRQTPTASPFPPLPPPRPLAPSLNQRRFRRRRCRRHCAARRRAAPFPASRQLQRISPPRRVASRRAAPRLAWPGRRRAQAEAPRRGRLAPSPPLRLPPEFLFLFLPLLVRGTRPDFTLRPALRGRQPAICEEVTVEKNHTFGVLFLSSLRMVGRGTARCRLAGGRPKKAP